MAPAFAGGKVVEHAIKNKVGMVTTEALISILRRHERFPFSIVELQSLFATSGLAAGVEDELGRVHAQRDDCIKLTSRVLSLFEELQRQQEVSEPISGRTTYVLLLSAAQTSEIAPPDRRQIDPVLSLLSNPVLGILARQDDGYVLTISRSVARGRLKALEGLMLVEQ